MASNDNDSNGGFSEIFRWIKFGPGIVGRTVPLMIVVSAVFGIALYKMNGSADIVLCLEILSGLVLAYLGIAFWYAHKHPEFSTLDGRSLVEYRRAQLSAGNDTTIDWGSPPVENQQTQEIVGPPNG